MFGFGELVWRNFLESSRHFKMRLFLIYLGVTTGLTPRMGTPRMATPRVAVFGGSGYIGSEVSRLLVDAGVEDLLVISRGEHI